MAKSKKSAQEKESFSQFTRREITEKLEKALAELKPALGDKKFKRRLKKAGKLISSGLGKKIKVQKTKAVIVPPVTEGN